MADNLQQLARRKSIEIFERQAEQINKNKAAATPEPEATPEQTSEPKKFRCDFEEDVRKNEGYTMDCYFFGCWHQINGTCPILNGG